MNTPKQSARAAPPPLGWVGNINTINKSDAMMVDLKKQFEAGQKSPSMRRCADFDQWRANCVRETSKIVLNMMSQVERGQRPISRELIIKQIARNQQAVANSAAGRAKQS